MPIHDTITAHPPSEAQSAGIHAVAEPSTSGGKGKWARIAEEISRKDYLRGCSEKLAGPGREFRENFFSRNG